MEKILITGDTEQCGLGVLLKLIETGHYVKVLDQYIYHLSDKNTSDHTGLGFRYNSHLVLIEGSPYDTKQLEESIKTAPFPLVGYCPAASADPACDTVVYLAPATKDGKDKINFNSLSALLKVSRNSGVKRFLYISPPGLSENEIAPTRYLEEITDSNFAGITIQSSVTCGRFSRLRSRIDVNIFKDKRMTQGKITVYAFNQGTSERYINSIPHLVLYLLTYSWEAIVKDLMANTATYRCLLNRTSFFQKLHEHRKDTLQAILRRVCSYMKYSKRFFDVFMMMSLLHLWPEQVYRFSTRGLLPDKTRRYPKGNPCHHAFRFHESQSSDIKKIKEVNLVIPRGGSFNLNQLENLKSPVYLGCLGKPIDNNKDYIYITTRRMSTYFKKLGYQVLILESYSIDREGNSRPHDAVWLDNTTDEHEKALYRKVVNETSGCPHVAMHEEIFRPSKHFFPSWAPVGSGLGCVYALSFIAEKVNVYGWDFHMTSSPRDMSYWQVLLSLYQYKSDKISVYQFESSILNFYYAYHLSRMPNINIHGYLGHLSKHKKLIDRIEKVLFNRSENCPPEEAGMRSKQTMGICIER